MYHIEITGASRLTYIVLLLMNIKTKETTCYSNTTKSYLYHGFSDLEKVRWNWGRQRKTKQNRQHKPVVWPQREHHKCTNTFKWYCNLLSTSWRDINDSLLSWRCCQCEGIVLLQSHDNEQHNLQENFHMQENNGVFNYLYTSLLEIRVRWNNLWTHQSSTVEPLLGDQLSKSWIYCYYSTTYGNLPPHLARNETRLERNENHWTMGCGIYYSREASVHWQIDHTASIEKCDRLKIFIDTW